MDVKGTSRIIAMIGDPIFKAKTPALLNPRLAGANTDAVIIPLHIPADSFANVFPGLLKIGNIDGFIVTYPFKEVCLEYVDRLSVAARLVGGLNAIRREEDGTWTGDIFDGVGLLNAVVTKHNPKNQRVLLIGAGGAGRAIAASFAQAGASSITIFELDNERADALVLNMNTAFPDCKTLRGKPSAIDHDIIINATPVGMNIGDGLPADIGPLRPQMTVVDIVPSKTPTALLRAAIAAQATAIPGSDMTEGQANALLQFFKFQA